ncbi:tail fiber protein, partial [Dickeya chrysanthemi]
KAYADDLMAKHLANANPHKQYAPLASPALTGTPTAPTAAAGTNTTQLATTAFVKNNAVWVYGSLAGLDLNSLTGSSAGRYWQSANAWALPSFNYPVSQAGSLDVEKNTANGVEGCIQRYTTYEVTPRVFLRSYHPLTKFWSEWQELAYLSSPEFTGRVKVTSDSADAVLVKAATANADVGVTLQTNLGARIAQLTYAAAGANTQFYSYKGANSIKLADGGDITITPKAGQTLELNGPIRALADGNQINLQQKTAAPTSGSYIRATNSDGVFLWIVGRSESNGWLELGGKGSNRIALADSGDITIAPGTGKTTKITSTVTLTAPAAGDNSSTAITSGWFAAELAGIPLPWPQATAPTGWLKCNGQSFDKKLYPRLAQVYPSGVLPDLRGEFIRGWDDGRGVDNNRGLLSSQGDTIRNIVASFVMDDQAVTINAPTGAMFPSSQIAYDANSNVGGTMGFNVVFDASRVVPTANENRPRNIAFNYIVRAA